ncbi:MAG TPA: GlmU family protein [Saprospiraceae bacterium]|nr:GlmU family protein [Saprospiraceae bacterium]HRX28619.1 GlmU family protein [Saprospiraceae bacterium]
MKNLIFFDDDNWKALLPLTYTRPICELRIGILTIKEKWEALLHGKGSYITQDYLSEKFGLIIEDDNYLINSTLLPNPELLELIYKLEINEVLTYNDELLVGRLSKNQMNNLGKGYEGEKLAGIDISNRPEIIKNISKPHHIFSCNASEIERDFELLTKNRTSQPIPDHVLVLGDRSKIFIEEGAIIHNHSLNATKGSIYIGKNAELMEGSMLQGPISIGEGSTVKMGAKMYGETTIGPHCKVGGEVGNSVLMGYSNKGHDGYLGNSVLGEWCNLGADTNNSNLKNNYSEVKLWSYDTEKFELTGLQFCGLIMGDHSKTGINTMFNTGTVVGVSANIFGDGYPRNFIPSFSWGGSSGFKTYKVEQMLDVAATVMKRRSIDLEEMDKKILEYVYYHSAIYRTWEK